MAKKVTVKWLGKPQAHDYPAALSYLSLIFDVKTAAGIVRRLQKSPMTSFKAKDIFRALPLLGTTNSHVKANQQKIRQGAEVSPLLLVRDMPHTRVLVITGCARL